MNIAREEPRKEIQDTRTVSGFRQSLKLNTSDYVDESATQYLRMRHALEDLKVIL